MKTVAKSCLAIAFGLGVGFVLVEGIELINHFLYPLPADVDVNNRDSLNNYFRILPTGAFVVVLGAWMIGTFFGAYVATWMAPKMRILHAMIIGILFQLAGVSMVCLYEHPPWFTTTAMASFLPIAALAGLIAERRNAPSRF